MEISEQTDYQEIYNFVLNDKVYSEILSNVISSANEISIDWSELDKELIAQEFTSIDSNVEFQLLLNYWARDEFNSDNKHIALRALYNATNDLILTESNEQASTVECERDYGIFTPNLEFLDCDQLEQEFGCCARLHCQVTNCGVEAYLEFADQIGISVTEGMMTTFSVAFHSIIKGLSGGISTLLSYVLIRSLVGTLHVLDLYYDSLACASEAFFNYERWTSPCDCDCPVLPECNLITGTTIGGYVFPVDCQ